MKHRALVLVGIACGCAARPPVIAPPTANAEPEPATDTAPAEEPCAAIEAQRAEFIAAHANDVHEGPGAEDHNYPPTCEAIAFPGEALDPVWAGGIAWCEVGDEIYGPTTCHLQFRQGSASAGLTLEERLASPRLELRSVAQQDIVPGGPAALVLRVALYGREHLVICRRSPSLSCTAPLLIATDDWATAPRFEAGQLVLDPVRGEPPPGVVGRHVLAFP